MYLSVLIANVSPLYLSSENLGRRKNLADVVTSYELPIDYF